MVTLYIPSERIPSTTGTTLCDYLQPFPPFGAGYFRYVFVLYKQNREIDFGQPLQSSNDLSARTFKTSEFYARHKDDLVPSGLAFFQSDYDSGVREVCSWITFLQDGPSGLLLG